MRTVGFHLTAVALTPLFIHFFIYLFFLSLSRSSLIRRLHSSSVLRSQPWCGRLPGAHPQLHDAHLPYGHHSSFACAFSYSDSRQPPPHQQPHLQRCGLWHPTPSEAWPCLLLQARAPAVLCLWRRWNEWLRFRDILRTNLLMDRVSQYWQAGQPLRSLNWTLTRN